MGKIYDARHKNDTQYTVTGEYINVEMEVTKRKYDVDVPKLIDCIQTHKKTIKKQDVAEILNKPVTLIEHWLRKDKCFAIPDADCWMKFKELLGICTDEFDEAIMTFETDGNKYDMSNRIYVGSVSPTLTTEGRGNFHLMEEQHIALDSHPADSRLTISKDNIVQTLSSRMGTGGNNTPLVMENKEPVLLESNQDHATIREDGISTSLVASAGEGGGYVPMVTQGINGDTAGTLDSNYFKGCGEREGTERKVVCVGNGQTAQLGLHDTAHTLDCMHDQQAVMENLVVRRLTPLECSRLQGLPDGWLDGGEWTDSKGKKHKESDAPKYKAAGNGVATPFWYWLLKRISEQLKKDGVEKPKMASLFDGVGSFPLLWQYINGDGTAIWSSEIEEYPIALTEKHLGENGDWQKYKKPECLEVIDRESNA